MISEFFLNIVFGISRGFLSLAPDISWSVDTTAFTFVQDILSVVGYFLPMGTVRTIVGLIIALTIFRVFVALGKTLWDLLPFA